MNGMFSGTVVPFRAVALVSRGDVSVQAVDAMKAFRVTAHYDYPPVERSVVLAAEAPQRAMVKALLEGKVPAFFRKDEFGWLLPIFWHPRLAGEQRWPTVIGRNVIAWGEKGGKYRIIFEVEEVEN